MSHEPAASAVRRRRRTPHAGRHVEVSRSGSLERGMRQDRRGRVVMSTRAAAVVFVAAAGLAALVPSVASAASSATTAAVSVAPAQAVPMPASTMAAYAVPASRPAAAPAPAPAAPTAPSSPGSPGGPAIPGVNVTVGGTNGATQSVTIIALLTVLSVAPALLLLCTSFTKIAVVLALTRQALGTPTIPPNQVLAGMALFLSLFVMSPVLSQSYDNGVQPYMSGKITDQSQALEASFAPMRTFMLEHTGKTELATMIKLSKENPPTKREDVSATTLIPAFVLSELKTAFIIGFVIFIPFLIIDLVVASILMSMGMMMLPPVMISLPFKLLLFIMVDGWSLITTALVTSYR